MKFDIGTMIFRKILKYILRILAKRIISRYRPIVIGITGSVGKTTAKEAIYAVLSRKFWVRKNTENFNNEFGIPMAVLGIDAERFNAISYKLSAMGDALWLVYGWSGQKYPKILILELAADRPGDIQYLVDIVKPQVGVVTAIGDVPVHVEFYASPEAVATEKGKLIERLPSQNGLAVLNYDDQTVFGMKEKSKAKIMTFGFAKEADVRISDIAYFVSDNSNEIGGLSFKLGYVGSFVPVRVNGLAGMHQIYGLMAAAVGGLPFNINLNENSGAL